MPENITISHCLSFDSKNSRISPASWLAIVTRNSVRRVSSPKSLFWNQRNCSALVGNRGGNLFERLWTVLPHRRRCCNTLSVDWSTGLFEHHDQAIVHLRVLSFRPPTWRDPSWQIFLLLLASLSSARRGKSVEVTEICFSRGRHCTLATFVCDENLPSHQSGSVSLFRAKRARGDYLLWRGGHHWWAAHRRIFVL